MIPLSVILSYLYSSYLLVQCWQETTPGMLEANVSIDSHIPLYMGPASLICIRLFFYLYYFFLFPVHPNLSFSRCLAFYVFAPKVVF